MDVFLSSAKMCTIIWRRTSNYADRIQTLLAPVRNGVSDVGIKSCIASPARVYTSMNQRQNTHRRLRTLCSWLRPFHVQNEVVVSVAIEPLDGLFGILPAQ